MGGVVTHCAVHNGLAYEGTKAEIVVRLYTYSLEDRLLKAKFGGWQTEQTFHSYGDSFTEQEMHRDVVEFLYDRLPLYGVRLYRDVG